MHSFRFDLGHGGGADRTHEKVVRVAGDAADMETGQLLIIKCCLCPVTFCSYKCHNIGLYHNSAVFYTFICNKLTKFLQADGGLSNHAPLGFSVGDVM